MLWSADPWFSWVYRGITIFALSGCFFLLRIILFTRYYKKNMVTYSVIICILFAFMTLFMIRVRNGGLIEILNFVRLLVVFILVLTMTNDEKKDIVSMTTNLYAWIVGVSIVGYVLLLAGVNMPYSIIEKPDSLFYPPFENYGAFILLSHDGRLGDFQRFQSVFTEPGHLGTISAILLYINKYDLKLKSVLVIFIGTLLSLSFAAYALVGLGYLIFIMAKSKQIHKTILKIGMVTVLVVSLGAYFYVRYPESVFSIMILGRLGFDESSGDILAERTRGHVSHFYETQFLSSTENILWGVDLSEAQRFALFGRGGSNSYRVFLINNGIISVIILFLMYFSIVAITPSKLGFGLLFLCSISFMQRIQTPLWEMQLFLFIGAVQCFFSKDIAFVK